MKPYQLIFILLISVLVCSCGAIYQTAYTYQPPKTTSGKMCVTQCLNSKNQCQSTCHKQDRLCRMTEHQKAYFRYRQYRDQQNLYKQPIKKSVNDFDESYFKCNVSCHCTLDFNSCYQHCGGTVLQREIPIDN